MNKKLVLLLLALITFGTAMAQKRVTGHVADESGNPVVGATVRVRGEKMGTQTDANGNFTLPKVPNNAKTLDISYLGMETQSVSVAATVSVVLKENVLEEAVVMGYGTAKKLGTVVGMVSKITSDKIENKPVTTALDALQGKVAGVQIYNNTGDVGDVQGTSTTVRGVGSLNGATAPLYVIDGQPVDASAFYMMNQNDIDSYTVLRDASATSIYGARAANGVIFVTTKKGRSGEKAMIKVGQSIGWSSLARRTGDPMNSTEILDYYFRNGVISGTDYAVYKASGINTDWQKYYFKKSAAMYNTNFSVQGASERISYYVSAAYMKKGGLTPYQKFKRYNVRTNLDVRPTDWLRMGLNLGLNYDERSNDSMTDKLYQGNNPAMGAVVNLPYYNPYEPDGSKSMTIPPSGSWNNDLWAKYGPYTANDSRLTGSAFIELTPVKGLTIKSQLAGDLWDLRSTDKRLPSAPWYVAQGNTQGGSINEYFSRSADWTITNTAEYRWEINTDHTLTFLLGQEGIKNTSHEFNSQTSGHSDDRLMELGSGTEASIENIGRRSDGSIMGHNKALSLSFFGRADYSYKDKYFANFTVRNDRSSIFGANNRSATFYSGGLMWDMKRENFLKTTDWLDELRLKFSVGSTGNSSGIGYYQALAQVGSLQYAGRTGWGIANPGNKDLGWETQIQTTLGFTARLWNRLNLEMNYYHRKTKDMLMDVPVPYTTGFSTQIMNIGEMVNQGIEISFDVDAVKNWNGLNVNVYGNFTYNANKITKLFYGLDTWNMPDYGLSYVVGESVNFYIPVRYGINPDNGNILWYVPDADGNYDKKVTSVAAALASGQLTEQYSDALYANTGKKRFAPINGGFGLNATWKGLTLNMDFSYVLGKYMIDNLDFFTRNSQFTDNNQDRWMLGAWQKPGDVTDVPRFGVNNQFDTSLLHNSSFMRLKNLSLSYDLPAKWMDATGFIRNIRLTAAARNLFTVTKWPGADPEYDRNLTKAGAVPNTREYTLGVEFTF